MRLIPAAALLLLLPMAARAAISTDVSFSPNLAIPDGMPEEGVADIQEVTSDIQQIESLQVTLTITGGWNGDYYVYLRHGDSFGVLMNRVGTTTGGGEDLGYGDSGVSVVTFTQSALNGDIHNYQQVSNPGGGPLTGTWQPDGRNMNPSLSMDSTPRTAMFDSFMNQPAAGSWTLYASDFSSGGMGTLSSWGLSITGAVPEPGSSALLLGAGFFALRGRRRPLRRR